MNTLIDELTAQKDATLSEHELVAIVASVTGRDVRNFLIRELSARSSSVMGYVHQLGFRKFIIATVSGTRTRTVRLHYWHRHSIFEDIHDHIASFSSNIIYGRLDQEFFHLARGGEDFDHRAFCAEGTSCIPLISSEKQAALRFDRRVTVNQSESYFLHHSQLHRARPDSDYAISLVVQDSPTSKLINVYTSMASRSQRDLHSSKLSKSELSTSFAEMIELLGANS